MVCWWVLVQCGLPGEEISPLAVSRNWAENFIYNSTEGVNQWACSKEVHACRWEVQDLGRKFVLDSVCLHIEHIISPLLFIRLVWTPCLMHRCVCIRQYILQNYNYKLHFQNLFIYDILHVSIGTLAAENLDVCTTYDPWDNNIQLTMVIDRRRQIYPNIVQCLTLTLVDCDRKCHSNKKLTMT
jgi:hypothetical protein